MNHADIDLLASHRLPDWAIKRAAGLEIGAQLPTKDGRVTGNAHIVDVKPAPRGRLGLNYLILTDAGNTFIMSEPEIEAQFYPPEFVGDLKDILKKFWRSEEKLVAV